MMTILHLYSADIQHLMNESEGLISNNKLPLKYKILACFPQTFSIQPNTSALLAMCADALEQHFNETGKGIAVEFGFVHPNEIL